MRRRFLTSGAVFFQLHAVLVVFFVLDCRVVALFALLASQNNHLVYFSFDTHFEFLLSKKNASLWKHSFFGFYIIIIMEKFPIVNPCQLLNYKIGSFGGFVVDSLFRAHAIAAKLFKIRLAVLHNRL